MSKNTKRFLALFSLYLLPFAAFAQESSGSFAWPAGYEMALSLTFDDARTSQPNGGADLLDKYAARATFYVMPEAVKQHLMGWKRIVAAGHEIGNHTLYHACTGNFSWSKDYPLEEYTLKQMEKELLEANRQIEALLGVTPMSFAYPCGETTIGRGVDAESYIPIVSRHFKTGRGWLDETSNDPAYVDYGQVRGMKMDDMSFEEILPLINQAKEQGYWLVLAGHEIGNEGPLTTRESMLKELLIYLRDAAPEIWLAPVNEVAEYVEQNRQ